MVRKQFHKVYKIFGPGNQYVTVAKQMGYTASNVPSICLQGQVNFLLLQIERQIQLISLPILLSQAEHGADSQVILVTTFYPLLELVKKEIDLQIKLLPRQEIAKQAIKNSRMVSFETNEETIQFINQYGPEHYIICMEEEQLYVDQIVNAGSVFIGNFTPESAGDYASGTNHTLPTNGYAKQYSGVNLDSFLKQMTFQKISKKGIQNIGPAIELMAAG